MVYFYLKDREEESFYVLKYTQMPVLARDVLDHHEEQ